MRLRDLPNEGRSDTIYLSPALIDVAPGFNLRPHDAAWQAKVREYADDMKARGYRPEYPIVVRTDGERPVVVAGHTRLAAAKLAISEGALFKGIPCVPEPKGANDATRIATMLLEPGTALPPLAVAEGVRRLMAFLHTEAKVAEQCNKSVAWVKQQLVLSSAPGELRDAVEAGEVSATEATKLTRKGPIAAVTELRQAREQLPEGRTRITAKTITKAAAPRKPALSPAQKAIQRILTAYAGKAARLLPAQFPELARQIEASREQLPHEADAAD